MITDIGITSISVAGIAILWRNLVYDNPKLRAALKKIPDFLNTALTCGFCFTFWISLVAVLVFDPLDGRLPRFRVMAMAPLGPACEIIFSWMIVGTIAAIIRFGYIAIQELVHYEVHHLNQREH